MAKKKKTPGKKATEKAKKTPAKARKAPVKTKKVTKKPGKATTKAKKSATAPKKTATGTKKILSVVEFSEMTYLTLKGVNEWLKQGKLKSVKDKKGNLAVDAASLQLPFMKNLIR